MRILVTGGAGFIGSNFIRHIFQNYPDWEVVNLDNLTYAGNLENLSDIESRPGYFFVKGDIADREFINELFKNYEFDYILNFAAESHVDRSIEDSSPFIETNIKGTQVLLEAARTHWIINKKDTKLRKFIQISTDEVYGSLDITGEFTENSRLQPNNPYAASKASADLLCRSYFKAFGLPVIITRSCNNYGPYQFPEKLIPVAIKNVLNGEDIPVYGEGKQIRDWLFVEDNCRAIDMVMQRGKVGEVYNIGGNYEMPNIEVVKQICSILRSFPLVPVLKPHIRFIEDPRGDAHDFRYCMDYSKIKHELYWRPLVSFEDGIRRTVEWYLENKDWIESGAVVLKQSKHK